MNAATRAGRRTAFPPLFLVLAIAQCGCSERIMRENVLATTQSMVGLQLAQNAQTQLYELKLGYARNEFFWVPTSKYVMYDDNGKEVAPPTGLQFCNDPSNTPEVLAEIQVGGRGKQGIGTDQGAKVEVYQRLAVGTIAVQSKAAVALMSNEPATAEAVATMSLLEDPAPQQARAQSAAAIQALVEQSTNKQFKFVGAGGAEEWVPWPVAVDRWSKELGFADYKSLRLTGKQQDNQRLIERWTRALASESRPRP